MNDQGPLAKSLSDMPKVAARLADGEQFTCYEHCRGGMWMVAIGPIGKHLVIAYSLNWYEANLVVDALRHSADQAPLLSRAFDSEDEQ